MDIRCYYCAQIISPSDEDREHIPQQCLYAGFDGSYKVNRITVPAHSACNQGFSAIDAEIRDVIGITNDDMTEESLITQKTVRALLKEKNWKERAFIDEEGNVRAFTFSYDKLKSLHIKHFKGIFYHEYKEPLPSNYKIEIIADGDKNLSLQANAFYDFLVSQNETWRKSGHEQIFKYIIKGVILDHETGIFEKNDDINKATFIACVMIYHGKLAVIVLAAKEEYLEANKTFYLGTS